MKKLKTIDNNAEVKVITDINVKPLQMTYGKFLRELKNGGFEPDICWVMEVYENKIFISSYNNLALFTIGIVGYKFTRIKIS